jgi:hypothetical protein
MTVALIFSGSELRKPRRGSAAAALEARGSNTPGFPGVLIRLFFNARSIVLGRPSMLDQARRSDREPARPAEPCLPER